MLNQIVYVRGEFVRERRQGLRKDQSHPLDAHMGRHVVARVLGEEIVLRPLYTTGKMIRVPAYAVWGASEVLCKLL